jgi:hypothetical protein
MKDNFVGEIINNLRMEAGISRAVLSKGLMHNRELSRIENGTKIPSKLLLDAIFQRLGKSADRIETILSYKEYQLIFLREKIESSLLKNDIIEYHKYYEEYRKVDDSVLTSQYLLMLKGISLFVEEENAENCETELLIKGIEVLKEAIYMTFPEWEKVKISMTYLSIQELQILCLIGYYEWKSDEKEKGKKILEEILKYVTIRFEDLQEKSKIYPHVLYYLAKINFTEGTIQVAKQNCNEAIKNLFRYGDIMFVKENLLLLGMCYKFEGLMDRFDNIKQYIDVIDEILDTSNIEYKIYDSTAILLTSLQSDIVLSGELIRLKMSGNDYRTCR